MKHLIKAVLTIQILAFAVFGHSEEISKAFMVRSESGEVVYIDKKTSRLRSKVSFSMKRTLRNERVIYKYTSHGEGAYDKYENAIWDIAAEMEEKDGFLYLLHSTRFIRDEKSDTGTKHEKRFDYYKRKIYSTFSDGKGKIIRKKTLPIKGKTADSALMAYFLRTFIAHRNDKAYRTFYIVSNDANLYRITIKNMGTEVVEIPLGKVKAVKVRLIPDLGLLTSVTRFFAPPLFVWYMEKKPHQWVKYEGPESRLGSKLVVTYISSKTPPP